MDRILFPFLFENKWENLKTWAEYVWRNCKTGRLEGRESLEDARAYIDWKKTPLRIYAEHNDKIESCFLGTWREGVF